MTFILANVVVVVAVVALLSDTCLYMLPITLLATCRAGTFSAASELVFVRNLFADNVCSDRDDDDDDDDDDNDNDDDDVDEFCVNVFVFVDTAVLNSPLLLLAVCNEDALLFVNVVAKLKGIINEGGGGAGVCVEDVSSVCVCVVTSWGLIVGIFSVCVDMVCDL